MIELRGIKKTFNPGTVNEHVAISGLDLSLNEGDFITVIGGNGAGKSTLLNIISGSISADEGLILLNGTDVSMLREYKRAPYFGRVFQDPMMGTAADMTILENLALARGRGRRRSLFRWSIKKDDKAYFIEQLKSLHLGLENRITQKVGLLSGGQRQALTLLMATMSQLPSHRQIRKDYVTFNRANPNAKQEVESAYSKGKNEFLAKKQQIKAEFIEKLKNNGVLDIKSLKKEEKQRIKEAFNEFDKEFRKFDVTKPVLLLDEHTAALDPQTANKVLTLTNEIVQRNHQTTIMITHNMNDAIKYGNRLIMISKGKIVVDVSGEEKQKLTIEQLLEMFTVASKDDVLSDATILG